MAYVTPAELGAALGAAALDPSRADLACEAATAAIDIRCHQSFPDPVPPPIRQAALFAAVRWYQRPLAPLGTQGGFDTGAVYVLSRDPDVERLLVGFRVGFGVA